MVFLVNIVKKGEVLSLRFYDFGWFETISWISIPFFSDISKDLYDPNRQNVGMLYFQG